MFIIPLVLVFALLAQQGEQEKLPEDNPHYRLPGSRYLKVPEDLKNWPPVLPEYDLGLPLTEDPTTMEIYDVNSGMMMQIPSNDLSQIPVGPPSTQEPPYLGLLNPGLDGESVIPPDDRVRITPTTSFPWRTICKVYITWPDSATGWGSAAIIDGYHILTAGHCVYSHSHGGWASSIRVVPAEDNGVWPYNYAWATYLRSYTGWTVSASPDHDWAMVTLDRNIGNYTGWMGRTTNATLSWYWSNGFNNAGYPADLDGGANMYYDFDNGCNATEYRHWYLMDTAGGHSGGPVWWLSGGNRYIVTIHAYGLNGCGNSGTRLNQDKYDRIISWQTADTPPPDRPDLVDDGQTWSGFSPTAVCAGDSFSAWCDVRNVGTASSGSCWVSFYASTNTTISTGDYLIGNVLLSSISPFAWADANLTSISFPASIPAGTYYIGWIIDRTGIITEFDETNNTEYKLGAQLTVRPEPGTPYGPNPADGATGVSLTPLLQWSGANATQYWVYFGTTSPPPYVTTVGSGAYAPGTLTPGQHYYWQIATVNTCGNALGPIWDFYAICPLPTVPTTPLPADGATDVAITANLDWADSAGATSYDVYFGTSSPPAFVANVASSDYDLPSLIPNQHYYWKIVAKNSCGDTPGAEWDFTTEVLFGSPGSYQVLPETIWAPATGGGTWVSEVQVTDLTGGSVVSVYYSPGGGIRRGPFTLWTSPGTNRSIKFTNLLSTIDVLDSGPFNYYGSVGAVEFMTQDDDHRIHVTIRTVNGNYAKTFPALNEVEENSATTTREMMIQNLTNNSIYRSSCVFFNPTPNAVTVQFRLIDGNGSVIGSIFSRAFVGYDYQYFNPFVEAGVPYPAYSYDNVFLYINPTSGTGAVICNGATANNYSNDPAAHIAVQYQGTWVNGPSSHQLLPEAIWAPATGGGTWVSEVQVTDLSGGSVVTVYYKPAGESRRGPFTLWTSPGANRSMKYTNILSTIDALDSGPFNYYGSVGAVEFMTQSASYKIHVAVRTVNGNYAKTFPALNDVATNCADTTREMMIQNLTNNSIYRSSCVFYNPTSASITVQFSLIDGNGNLIGSTFSRTFSGYDYQFFNPFVEAGRPYPTYSYDNVFLLIDPISGSGRVNPNGATANNYSNDPAAHIAVQYR